MSKIVVMGGRSLHGSVDINGAKNASLPILASTLLFEESVILRNVPNINDTKVMTKIMSSVGASISFGNSNADCGHTISILSNSLNSLNLDRSLSKQIRASLLLLAPLIVRCGTVAIPCSGGCNIGLRPIDFHLDVLSRMGVTFSTKGELMFAQAKKLHGADFIFNKISVGATETAILAAVLAEGRSTFHNIAIEPEVMDLITFLVKAGAKIRKHGVRTIVIDGVKNLNSCEHSITPDRIEAGTYMLAAIMTRGELVLRNIKRSQIVCIANAIERLGGSVTNVRDGIFVRCSLDRPRSINIKTAPYPGIPSDMQSQFLSAMCTADSVSVIEENIFESRFLHVPELRKMGAVIDVEGNKAFVRGVENLYGDVVRATDLRASAALLLAALSAKNETIIENIHFLYRGYEEMESKLKKCGAYIYKTS